MIDGIAYVNGRFVASANARISIFDRGLMYGDGLFETLRSYRGRIFALQDHLARLRNSAQTLEIPLPAVDWEAVAREMLRRNDLDQNDAWVRVAVTRGIGGRGLAPTPGSQPSVIMTCGRLDPTTASRQRHGVSAVTLPFGRNPYLAGHKTANYLDGVFGKQIATRANAYEGLFRGSRGDITEGAVSNIFWVVDGVPHTPPLPGLLPGVTRAHIMAIAAADGVLVKQQRLPTRALVEATEAFLTSSLAEVLPLTHVDGQAIGIGKPGAVTRRLQRLYRQFVRRELRRT